MVDIIQFYPNMLKTYFECPNKFKFKYLEKINLPTKAVFFDKGKKIHALANYYLKGQDISKLQEVLTYEEKEIFEKLKNNEYFQKMYINSEYNLSCKISDFWIAGRLDALVKDFDNEDEAKAQKLDCHEAYASRNDKICALQTDNQKNPIQTYFILDYKTGSVPKNPKYDFQTMIYLLMANKLLSEEMRARGQKDCKNVKNATKDYVANDLGFNLLFVYIDLKNNQNIEIKLDENLKLEYEKIIVETCSKIQKNVTFDCKKTDKCVFCEYSRLCL